MGLLKGIIQFTGSFDGLSFYKTRQGPIVVRTTGGFRGDAIRAKPNYQRTRENAMEFKHVVTVGKFFSLALRAYLRPMRIPYGHNRVVQLFHQVKKLDTIHLRGYRKVYQGFQSAEGKSLLHGFEFDPRHAVGTNFTVPYSFSSEAGSLSFNGFESNTIYFAKGSHKAIITFAILRVNFENLDYQLSEERTFTFGRNTLIPPTTLSTALPLGTGSLLGVLSLTYFQEISGQLVPLQERGLRLLV
jgi:hypothetical protein